MHILFITQLIIYNRKTTINLFLFIVIILFIVIVTHVGRIFYCNNQISIGSCTSVTDVRINRMARKREDAREKVKHVLLTYRLVQNIFNNFANNFRL